MPSRNNLIHEELRFSIVKNYAGKYVAYCAICEKELTNTALARLRSHRKLCTEERKLISYHSNSRNLSSGFDEDPLSSNTKIDSNAVTEEEIVTIDVIPMYFDEDSNKGNTTQSLSPVSSPSTMQIPTSSFIHNIKIKEEEDSTFKRNKKQSIIPKSSNMTYTDQISEIEIQRINSKLFQFIMRCDIPFGIVNSNKFMRFCNALNPNYIKNFPTEETLITLLLDKEYSECFSKSVFNFMNKDSVLIISSVDQSNYCLQIVSFLVSINGKKTFLSTYEFNSNQKTKTQIYDVISDCKKIAKEVYKCDIFAILYDNIDIVQPDEIDCGWPVECSSYLANFLCKDIVNYEINNQISKILLKFENFCRQQCLQHSDNSKIVTIQNNTLFNYKEAYECYLENVYHIRSLQDNKQINFDENLECFLNDENILQSIRDYHFIFDKLYNIVSFSQSKRISLGEVAVLWLNLEFPENYSNIKIKEAFKTRKKLFLNKYALTAAYLHPNCQGTVKFSRQQMEIINEFLLDEIGTDCDGVIKFKEKEGMFAKLLQKGIRNANTYWKLIEPSYPKLSKLALKLNRIPGTTDDFKRAFEDCCRIYAVRERFSFETGKKLFHTYFSIKFDDDSLTSVSL